MKIVMIGAGYVGLVSGACFAEMGHSVTCVDKDPRKIDTLRTGGVPIYEPGLEALCARNVAAGRLAFTDDLTAAVQEAEAVFLCVGTPPDKSTGQADLSYVFAAAEETARAIRGAGVLVTKSTVPVGTNREVARRARKANPDADFVVASNPEFLREGAAIKDFLEPDRIVAGVDSARAREAMEKIYAPLTDKGAPLMLTDIETAEIIKYAANAFLATKVAFINEIANLCETVGGDVTAVAKGMGLDERIGARFLLAGPGYGGSCFPKDTSALAWTARRAGTPTSIVEAVIQSNDDRKKRMAEKILLALGPDMRGKTVAVLGVAFKGGTDDMRDSPALDIIPALQAAGVRIRAFDPAATETARPLLPDVDWTGSVNEALEGADIATIITDWEDFRGLDLLAMRRALKSPVLVDLRNLYNPEDVRAAGLRYHSIGRAIATPDQPPRIDPGWIDEEPDSVPASGTA